MTDGAVTSGSGADAVINDMLDEGHANVWNMLGSLWDYISAHVQIQDISTWVVMGVAVYLIFCTTSALGKLLRFILGIAIILYIAGNFMDTWPFVKSLLQRYMGL